jgi:hypothetical protein
LACTRFAARLRLAITPPERAGGTVLEARLTAARAGGTVLEGRLTAARAGGPCPKVA